MSRTRIAVAMAMAIAIAMSAAAGCGDGDGVMNAPVTAIVLAPGEVVLPRPNAVMQLTVTALTLREPRDVTADPATGYTSGNTSVASVIAGGEVIANGIGETMIVARNGAFSDTAVVRVDTLAAIAVAEVAVTPESVSITTLGQTRGTTTTVTWANGAELRAQSGPPIAYATSDDSVAAVDAAGVITALANGAAVVTASFGERSDSVLVEIDATPPVSFSQRILPRFTAGVSRCIDAQCHPDAPTAQRNLRMTSHANITRGDSENGPVVMPGDGANSLLVRVLRGDVPIPITPRMPQNRTKFTSAFIDTIELWIDQGALDN